jgi:hypothetical protein
MAEEDLLALTELVESLGGPDRQEAIESALDLSEVISTIEGPDGEALGEFLRPTSCVESLARMLGEPSAESKQAALQVLANLCSDAVDPFSSKTKRLLLDVGAAPDLMRCLSYQDSVILTCCCGLLQNLCVDQAWAMQVAETGGHRRLEQLRSSDEPLIAQYSAGALANANITLRSHTGLTLAQYAEAEVLRRVVEAERLCEAEVATAEARLAAAEEEKRAQEERRAQEQEKEQRRIEEAAEAARRASEAERLRVQAEAEAQRLRDEERAREASLRAAAEAAATKAAARAEAEVAVAERERSTAAAELATAKAQIVRAEAACQLAQARAEETARAALEHAELAKGAAAAACEEEALLGAADDKVVGAAEEEMCPTAQPASAAETRAGFDRACPQPLAGVLGGVAETRGALGDGEGSKPWVNRAAEGMEEDEAGAEMAGDGARQAEERARQWQAESKAAALVQAAARERMVRNPLPVGARDIERPPAQTAASLAVGGSGLIGDMKVIGSPLGGAAGKAERRSGPGDGVGCGDAAASAMLSAEPAVSQAAQASISDLERRGKESASEGQDKERATVQRMEDASQREAAEVVVARTAVEASAMKAAKTEIAALAAADEAAARAEEKRVAEMAESAAQLRYGEAEARLQAAMRLRAVKQLHVRQQKAAAIIQYAARDRASRREQQRRQDAGETIRAAALLRLWRAAAWRQQQQAAVVIQASARRRAAVHTATQRKEARAKERRATLHRRRLAVFSAVAIARTAAVVVQAVARGRQRRLLYKRQRQSAVMLQALARGRQRRRLNERQRKGAVVMQAAARGMHQCLLNKRPRKSAICVQAAVRGRQQRLLNKQQSHSAVAIQAYARRYIAPHRVLAQKASLARTLHREREGRAVSTIQRCARSAGLRRRWHATVHRRRMRALRDLTKSKLGAIINAQAVSVYLPQNTSSSWESYEAARRLKRERARARDVGRTAPRTADAGRALVASPPPTGGSDTAGTLRRPVNTALVSNNVEPHANFATPDALEILSAPPSPRRASLYPIRTGAVSAHVSPALAHRAAASWNRHGSPRFNSTGEASLELGAVSPDGGWDSPRFGPGSLSLIETNYRLEALSPQCRDSPALWDRESLCFSAATSVLDGVMRKQSAIETSRQVRSLRESPQRSRQGYAERRRIDLPPKLSAPRPGAALSQIAAHAESRAPAPGDPGSFYKGVTRPVDTATKRGLPWQKALRSNSVSAAAYGPPDSIVELDLESGMEAEERVELAQAQGARVPKGGVQYKPALEIVKAARIQVAHASIGPLTHGSLEY